jgi:hypothetical protein
MATSAFTRFTFNNFVELQNLTFILVNSESGSVFNGSTNSVGNFPIGRHYLTNREGYMKKLGSLKKITEQTVGLHFDDSDDSNDSIAKLTIGNISTFNIRRC